MNVMIGPGETSHAITGAMIATTRAATVTTVDAGAPAGAATTPAPVIRARIAAKIMAGPVIVRRVARGVIAEGKLHTTANMPAGAKTK